MKEHTRITTLQITEVVKDEPEAIDFVMSEAAKNVYASSLCDLMYELLHADNVVVTGIQDFVQDGVKESCV